MASSRKRWMLTEANLRRLQPSLIQPMAPVSISSGDDDDGDEAAGNEDPAVDAVIAREAPAARVARLRTWVYNAMLTLVGLGDEGVAVLAVDELYIAGPGDVRLRAEYHKHGTARLKQEDEGQDDAEEEERGDKEEDENDKTEERREGPDLNDPAYWQAKLRYLEAKCRPLSQERRKRRRLAPASQIAAEDAARAEAEARAAEGRGFGCGYDYPTVGDHQHQHQHQQQAAAAEVLSEEQRQRQREERQAREEARAERARIEQSKLLWRDKRSSIERWVQALPPPPPLVPKSPPSGRPYWAATGGIPAPSYGGLGGPAFDSNCGRMDLPPTLNHQHQHHNQHPAAALSDSSIVEITPAQFSNVQPPQPQATVQQPPLQQQSQTLTIANRLAGEGHVAGLHVPHAPVVGTESTAATAQPLQQHTAAHAMADASLDLSAVTAATAPPTAATPATLAMDTPNTSASPGEGPLGDDALAPPGAAAWPKSHKRESHGHPSTSAVLGKRRRVGTDMDNDGGRA